MGSLAWLSAFRSCGKRSLWFFTPIGGLIRTHGAVATCEFSKPSHISLRTLGQGGAISLIPALNISLRSFHRSVSAPASLQVQVPPLGESITDGTVAVILKQPGEFVEEDDPILQIETDKVTIDVRSPKSGTVEAILVSIIRRDFLGAFFV